MAGKLIILSAPSGSGKTTIKDFIMQHTELGLHFSVSYTSRLPRTEDTNGVTYHFISREEFISKIEANEMLEYQEVYKNGDFYGTPHSEVDAYLEQGTHVLFDIDVEGGINMKKIFGDEALLIFIQAPSIEEIRRRLEKRGDSAAEVEKRVRKAEYELSFRDQYDKIVINDNLSQAKEQTLLLIKEFTAS